MVVVLAAAVSLLVLIYVARIRTSRPALVSLRRLLDAGVAAAEAGGDEVRRVRLSNRLAQQSKGKTREGANDPLTAGDLSSHRVMYGGLSATFPGLSVRAFPWSRTLHALPRGIIHLVHDRVLGSAR